MRTVQAVAFSLLTSVVVFSQAPRERLEFEVASVRPSPAARAETVNVGLRLDGSQARITSFSIQNYVAMAYQVKDYQVSGPDWISTERFDLNAKLPAGATSSQIPEMLQTFLVDRFQVKIHREKKDLPVYALIVGKTPLKLTATPPGTDAVESRGTVSVAAAGSAAGVSVNLGGGSSYTFANNKFEAKKISMDSLATMLERYVDRPIVNLTELKGIFDLTLEVTPEDYQAMLIRAAVSSGVVLPPQALRLLDAGNANSLFDGLQRLGLKLDTRKTPLDFLVIEHVMKTPSEN